MEQIFYTASPESHQIHVWQLDSEGAVTLLQVVDTIGQVQPMVVSSDRMFLYVGVRPSFCLVAYKIDVQGKLEQVGYAPLPGSPTHISIDRKGRFIFVASYNEACVSVSSIRSNGLPEAPFQVIKGLEGCHSANIDLSNQTLFVPALKQDLIYLFTLSKDGNLIPYPQVGVSTTTGVGPRHMVFHPNQNYAYCVNELNSSVDIWDISSREVRKVRSLDMMPKNFIGRRWGADIHLTPDGRYLYSCDRTASIITIFSVNPDGSELTIEGYKPTEIQPRGFNIDGTGRYLVAAGQKSHHIEVYKIIIDRGLLQPLARYAVGQGPMCVAFMN